MFADPSVDIEKLCNSGTASDYETNNVKLNIILHNLIVCKQCVVIVRRCYIQYINARTKLFNMYVQCEAI